MVGPNAVKLELPAGSRGHNVINVSQLKRAHKSNQEKFVLGTRGKARLSGDTPDQLSLLFRWQALAVTKSLVLRSISKLGEFMQPFSQSSSIFAQERA